MLAVMAPADPRLERDLLAFAAGVQAALGDALVSLVAYGSALDEDWVTGRSDVNTAVVVRRVTSDALDRLAQLIPQWRRRGFALPLVIDPEFLTRAADAFPIELDDIRRRHRLLAGADVFAGIAVDPASLRRQCEREARAKALRLRALFLETAERPAELERLLVDSVKSFLIILRHVLHLRGDDTAQTYADVLAAGERALGPLPAMRRLLDHRRARSRLARGELRAEFARYLTDVERVVAAVDTLHA